MPLTVISFATYLTAPPEIWREDDSAAYKFVQAIKHKPFKGYGYVPVNGTRLRLNQDNATDAIGWFAIMAADAMDGFVFDYPPVLVPVPNSDCAVSNETIPRTLAQARELSARLKGSSVLDCLRWDKVMPSASKQGGTRHPQILYDNLSLTAKLPKKREFILIDDVKTTGGHLQAARSMFLDREGVCDLAVCAARTVKVQSPQIFGPDIEELADWRPTESLY